MVDQSLSKSSHAQSLLSHQTWSVRTRGEGESSLYHLGMYVSPEDCEGNRVKGAWICAPHYTPPPWACHPWWVFRLKPSSEEHSAFRHISGWVSRGHHRRIMDSSREASGLAKSTSLMALPWGLGGKGEGTGNNHQWTPALMKRKQALKRINHSLLHGYATALRIEWDCVTCVLPCTFVSTFFFFLLIKGFMVMPQCTRPVRLVFCCFCCSSALNILKLFLTVHGTSNFGYFLHRPSLYSGSLLLYLGALVPIAVWSLLPAN